MKRICIVLAVAAVMLTSFCSKPKTDVGDFPEPSLGTVASKLTRDTILIGDQVQWLLPLQIAEGEEFFFEPMSNPLTEGVETIGKFKVDTLRHRHQSLDLLGRITITCFDSGTFFLPPELAAVQRLDGSVDTLLFDGPVLEVTTIPIDTATFKPFDIKGQIGYPVTVGEVAPWAGGAIVLAVLLFLLIRWLRMRRQMRDIFGKPIVKDPPHVVALRSLDKIRRQKLWQSDRQKQFYTAVTDALRVYISGRFGIGAQEMPSRQMLGLLKKQKIDQASFDEISELFGRADLVKFAKYTASSEENEQTIPQAVRFVNSTFLQEIEEEEKKEEK